MVEHLRGQPRVGCSRAEADRLVGRAVVQATTPVEVAQAAEEHPEARAFEGLTRSACTANALRCGGAHNAPRQSVLHAKLFTLDIACGQ